MASGETTCIHCGKLEGDHHGQWKICPVRFPHTLFAARPSLPEEAQQPKAFNVTCPNYCPECYRQGFVAGQEQGLRDAAALPEEAKPEPDVVRELFAATEKIDQMRDDADWHMAVCLFECAITKIFKLVAARSAQPETGGNTR